MKKFEVQKSFLKERVTNLDEAGKVSRLKEVISNVVPGYGSKWSWDGGTQTNTNGGYFKHIKGYTKNSGSTDTRGSPTARTTNDHHLTSSLLNWLINCQIKWESAFSGLFIIKSNMFMHTLSKWYWCGLSNIFAIPWRNTFMHKLNFFLNLNPTLIPIFYYRLWNYLPSW